MPGLVKYGDGVGLNNANRAAITTSYDIYDDSGYLVGYCTNIERTDARTVTRLRHLSSKDAGRVVEQASQPETVDLTVGGFALYNSEDFNGDLPHYSLAARLSRGVAVGGAFNGEYVFKSINSQKIPFNISVKEVHPGTGVVSLIYYMGCMLTRWAKPINLTNLWVAETANIQVAYVDIPTGKSRGGETDKVIS